MHVAAIGDSRRSIVVVRDITQRKQMEDALKEEKDFTNTAINAMTGIFFVQDREGRFIRWNDTHGTSGWTAEQILVETRRPDARSPR